MKKTLFPLILISLTFVISSISVIADITTLGRLNNFNHFFAILMLVSLALFIYSFRINKQLKILNCVNVVKIDRSGIICEVPSICLSCKH